MSIPFRLDARWLCPVPNILVHITELILNMHTTCVYNQVMDLKTYLLRCWINQLNMQSCCYITQSGPALGSARCSIRLSLQMLRASNKKLSLISTPHLNKKIYIIAVSFFSTRLSIFQTLVLFFVHKSDPIKPPQICIISQFEKFFIERIITIIFFFA